jgi:hypothetical protein
MSKAQITRHCIEKDSRKEQAAAGGGGFLEVMIMISKRF